MGYTCFIPLKTGLDYFMNYLVLLISKEVSFLLDFCSVDRVNNYTLRKRLQYRFCFLRKTNN